MDLLRLFPFSPNSLAFLSEKKSLSYAELFQQVSALTCELKKKGVTRGSRVAFLGYPDLSGILLFLSLLSLNAIMCPLNFRLPPQNRMDQLDQLGANFFIPDLKTIQPLQSKISSLSSVISLIFTSGTESIPKIACHSLDNYIYSFLGSQSLFPLNHDSRVLLSLPLYHIGGLMNLFRTFSSGATLILRDQPWEKLSFTHACLIPTHLQQLLKSPTKSEGRRLLIGGDRLPAFLKKSAEKKGWSIQVSYGMTEMTATIAIDGALLPFREAIFQEKQLYVRGQTLFLGYLVSQKPHLPLKEGWFATGDLGHFNPHLKILGRKDNLFISGGENIQCEEIEQTLLGFENIEEAVVVPVADPLFGMRPIAFLKGPLENSLHFSEQLKSLLPSYKIPIAYYLLPTYETLKPSRKHLKKLAANLYFQKERR
jgi:o-succinylbenzoate---CoA ligase